MKCPDCGSAFNVGWRGVDTEEGHMSSRFIEITFVLAILALLFEFFLPTWTLILVLLLFVFLISLELRVRFPCPKCGHHISAWLWTD